MKRLIDVAFLSVVVSVLVGLASLSACGGQSPMSKVEQAPSSHALVSNAERTPVILFPGWLQTALHVSVRHQIEFPGCPEFGSFDFVMGNPNPSEQFTQICQDKLLTLVLDPDARKPMSRRIGDHRGVKVSIVDYGKTTSAPAYEPLFAFLEQAGYVRNVNIRVAGWDSRLTPDLGGFMERTVELIEETYRRNHNTPVHLVGHSNGPVYALYVLNHTSQAWRDKYIHGFTALAGNWPGQGGGSWAFFTGYNFNIPSPGFPPDPENVATSAAMFQSWPGVHISCADPRFFGSQEVVIGIAGGTQYTPQDYAQLFQDAQMPLAMELAGYYLGFVKFATPEHFPNVDVYAEIGSGLPTLVGMEFTQFPVTSFYDIAGVVMRDGDGNQEDLTNYAIKGVWDAMPCHRFEFHENTGVDHMSLPSNPGVLERLSNHLLQPRSECSIR